MLESYALRLARMHQLYATISDDNLASRRLFEKAGYEASGRLIDWHYDGVKYQNCTFYAKILKKNASKDLVE